MQRLARSGIDANLFRLQSFHFRKRLHQIVGQPVGIATALRDDGGRRLARRSSGPERAFVLVNLDAIHRQALPRGASEHRFGHNAKCECGRSGGRQAEKRTTGGRRNAETAGHHAPPRRNLTAESVLDSAVNYDRAKLAGDHLFRWRAGNSPSLPATASRQRYRRGDLWSCGRPGTPPHLPLLSVRQFPEPGPEGDTRPAWAEARPTVRNPEWPAPCRQLFGPASPARDRPVNFRAAGSELLRSLVWRCRIVSARSAQIRC